ncbi:MAG: heavy-metal-associated domain-containing protein [Sphingobacteriaceae bacterium]|nr:heavy-metal-associated domain-containing protein [Sphingobacteriaceae bacterium]
MSGQNLKFKTNIKCGGCIATVSPFLNETAGVKLWEVDTVNKDKILTVEGEGISADIVIEKVQKAGFKAELIS